MSFLKALFRSKEKTKRREYKNITKDVDPLENWVKVSELGDGAFGKVYKVISPLFGVLTVNVLLLTQNIYTERISKDCPMYIYIYLKIFQIMYSKLVLNVLLIHAWYMYI